MRTSQTDIRSVRWVWSHGYRIGAESPGRDGPPVKSTPQGQALAEALTALSEGVESEGRDERNIDLFLDAGGCNAGALCRFADLVDAGRRIRPSYAMALEPSQAVVEAINRVGWTGQVVTVVSDGWSAPILPVALARPQDWTCQFRAIAELRVAEPADDTQFTGSVTAVLVRPESASHLATFASVADAVAARGRPQ